MELTRKEIYRNQKVSLGVTLLSFVVMLLFFIFTNIVSANSSTFLATPQLTLSLDEGSNESSASLSEEKILSASSQKENPASKIQTAQQAEVLVEKGVQDIVNNFRTGHFINTFVNTAAEASVPINGNDKTGTHTETKGSITMDGSLGFDLTDRKILVKPAFDTTSQEEGTVVVEITVDKSGRVMEADPNGRGTTTSSSSLKTEAARMALATIFNAQQKFEEQKGTITIIFSFH